MKYYCYESGQTGVLTMEMLQKQFETDENLATQKEQGTTFESWIAELLKMQVIFQAE